MLPFVFSALLVAALLCLLLNRRVPTRWLGFVSAFACAAAALLLLVTPSWEALTLPRQAWATLDGRVIWLALQLDQLTWPVSLVLTLGSALTLVRLAITLPASLRGFGGLFAALLLFDAAVLAGLSLQDLTLLPFFWALAALLGFSALRASGAFATDGLPRSLLAGLGGALVLVSAVLALPGDIPGAVPAAGAMVGWLLAALIALGAPPFHAGLDEAAAAPAGIAAGLVPLGVPLLGSVGLIRFLAGPVNISSNWYLVCTIFGVLTFVVCAAGALSERRLRRLLGWQFSAQLGLVLVALGQGPVVLAQMALPLLLNSVLSTLAGYLAVAALEQRAGTDDLRELSAVGPLLVPGIAMTLAAASAVGVPGTWGFWLRLRLYADLSATVPVMASLVLAAHTLLALAFVGPVIAFWRVRSRPTPEAPRTFDSAAAALVPALAALPLLAFGVAPHLARSATALPGVMLQLLSVGAALLLLGLPLLTQRRERVVLDPETRSTTPVPDALADSVRWLAWLGEPEQAFRGSWTGLHRGSQLLQRALAVFEERYYLAGLMIAVVMVILFML